VDLAHSPFSAVFTVAAIGAKSRRGAVYSDVQSLGCVTPSRIPRAVPSILREEEQPVLYIERLPILGIGFQHLLPTDIFLELVGVPFQLLETLAKILLQIVAN